LARAQDPKALDSGDFAQSAVRVSGWRRLLQRGPLFVEWLDGGAAVWFQLGPPDRPTYVRVDCATGERHESQDEASLPDGHDLLQPQRGDIRSRNGGVETSITFANHLDRELRLQWIDAEAVAHDYGVVAPQQTREQGTYRGHAWRLVANDGEVTGAWFASRRGEVARADESSRQAAAERNAWEARERVRGRVFLQEQDLWLRTRRGEVQLTHDGRADDHYRGDLHLAPDGQALLAFQTEPAQEHLVTVIELRPSDRAEPKLHSFQYLKPGDRIARPRPRLFDLRTRTRIAVDEAPFIDAWSIDRVHWAKDGSEVHVLYNRRGHQQLSVLAIDAKTGTVRTVVEERSETFVDYSQKTMLHWLDASGELLWASERDGHCHLYRVEVATGAITQVTKGAWNVRSVEHVDEAAREVWIAALGFHEKQDPYHRHLLRVPLDGGAPIAITQSDGEHEWEMAPDRSHAVVRWSRIDHPRVTELRRCSDGALMAELGRDDFAPLLEKGFAPAQRFVSKGRDDTTDIHGIVLRPSHFDATKKYPVLEAIYAGPHDFHVPKSFDLQLRLRALCELGFVVVQIDGMGTNWRSKAFHDVCWRNLKDAGFPDRIAWLRALAAQHPEVDLTRVGVFGGSAGGQSALGALLFHGDFYKAAAADCGCHDNRMDKIWWNEAWMGYPVGPWYQENSNVEHAHRLEGKLLLTVGELDRNVDPASTLQVVDALLKAEKDFEFVLVPGGGHGCGEMPTLAKRRAEFFVRHLIRGS
jgi:dipeptidyl aminopeptidase/acylaminoacyl peptidase